MPRVRVSEQFFSQLPRLAGLLVALLGMAVIIGWHEHWLVLIQIHPAFAPMKFDTAVGFILCGTGLVSLTTRHAGLARWLGGLGCALGGLILLEYVTGQSLGLDEFFVRDDIQTATLFPGRMSQLAASCFVVLGAGLAICGARRRQRRPVIAAGLLACMVTVVGVFALLGYVLGVDAATGWGAYTRMALHTSAAFVFLGGGLLAWSWQSAGQERGSFLRWMPITASVTLMGMVASITVANMEGLNDAAFWRKHTFQTILTAQSFENNLIDMQRGMRGYVTDGDTNALASFQSASRLEEKAFDRLVSLTVDNPSQQQRLRGLTTVMEDLFSCDNGLIDVYNRQGLGAVIRADSGGQSRIAFGRAHDVLKAFSEEEQRLLDVRDASEQAKFRSAERLLVFGSVLAAGLLLFANLMAGHQLAKRQRAEARLADQAEKLRSSNQELEQFAYVASHDMREPLRAVSGFAQILKQHSRDQLDARAHEMIGHIVDGAKRMADIIDDLLALSRLGSQGKPFQRTEIKESLALALKNLSVVIRERAAVIECNPLPVLPVDGSQMSLLFQNLVGNAVKFCNGHTPEVRVGATDEGNGFWKISVRDNGIGIEPQYFDRIFGIFQRLHTREEYPGTGIGLAICKKIVERHGGQIWLESKPGEGTTFYFTLPERQKEHGEQSAH